MKITEHIKLAYRANRYKNKNDKGGIAFILSSIKAGQTAFDIGAHKAGYLYFMRQMAGESGKVFAFEPQSSLYNYIVRIKKLFHWNNVRIEHLALSDSAGKVTLYIPSDKKGTASSPGGTIVRHSNLKYINSTEEVLTETLDSYCQRNNIKPDFLKIDVEGNELRVLKGGLAVLKKHRPKILVECEGRHAGKENVLEIFDMLKNLGYIGSFISGIKRIPIAEFDFERNQNPEESKTYCNNFTFE